MHGKTTSQGWLLVAAALLYLALAGPANAEEEAVEPPAENQPHIALILPTQAARSLAAPAEVVSNGALAAQEALGGDNVPPLRLYPTGARDEEALVAYRDAVAHGAVGVIGPLTRGAIAKLAGFGKLPIPVLALNTLDQQKTVPNLYALGLSIEAEARQIAAQMYRDGLRKPLVIETDGVLSSRMREAFAAEWQQRAGQAPVVMALGADKNALWKLRESVAVVAPDAIFLASGQKNAHVVRPYLGNDRPVYATSQVWNGKFGRAGGTDLAGVKFVDMPWLLEPYQQDVLAFKRSAKPLVADMERLYALGVDAYRLSLLLLVAAPGAAIEMQGVSGTLHLSETRQFSRELMRADIGGQPRTPPPPKPEPEAVPATPAEQPAVAPAEPAAQPG